ncbi:MAG: FlgD immunoglobulin-like domain containing protein [Bacteroidia bacterium]
MFVIHRVAVHNNSLNVSANTITTFTAQFPANGGIGIATTIFSVFPHSHHLCKSILSYAYTATDTIPLIKINKWDFDFQGYYTFRRPVKILPSYQLFAKHVFDNTSQNTDNPNSPPANISFGPNSANEMMIDSYQCLEYRNGDEFINVDSLLANDSMLIASIKQTQFLAKNINNYAFPNPFLQNVNIGYTLDKASVVSVNIYNSEGVRVKIFCTDNETEGLHQKVWDGKNNEGQKLSGGNYFYIIRVDDKSCAGKIILLP